MSTCRYSYFRWARNSNSTWEFQKDLPISYDSLVYVRLSLSDGLILEGKCHTNLMTEVFEK